MYRKQNNEQSKSNVTKILHASFRVMVLLLDLHFSQRGASRAIQSISSRLGIFQREHTAPVIFAPRCERVAFVVARISARHREEIARRGIPIRLPIRGNVIKIEEERGRTEMSAKGTKKQ